VYGSRASTAAFRVSIVSSRLSSTRRADAKSSREFPWRLSFCLESLEAAPRTSTARASHRIRNTPPTTNHTVRVALATLASRGSGRRCTWATPTGLPVEDRSGDQTTTACSLLLNLRTFVETSLTSAIVRPLRVVDTMFLRVSSARWPGGVETTRLPRRDQTTMPVTSSDFATARVSRRRVRELATTRFVRTSIGVSTESVYSATCRALSSRTCSRKLFVKTDERTNAPTPKIAAEASTKVQSRVNDLINPAER